MEKLVLENNVGIISLPQLKRTIDETTLGRKPLNGIQHHEIFDRVMELTDKNKLSATTDQIYVSKNGISNMPGITIIPAVEEKYGEGAIEASIIRRLLGKVHIHDSEDALTNTVIAISYHQQGFQLAYGTNVRICSNLCVFGGKIISSYGERSIKDINQMFQVLNDYLGAFKIQREADQAILNRMSEIAIGPDNIISTIGKLEELAVRKAYLKGELSPLNISQVSSFTKRSIVLNEEEKLNTLYDLYNCGTQEHHADQMDFSTLLPANNAFSNFMINQHKDSFSDIIEKYGSYLGLN